VRYYIDTEFMESPGRLELISIGIVAEDGREFYAEAHFNENNANDWVRANVLPSLTVDARARMLHADIRETIRAFISTDKPEFWGYYADYDWVVFCWLFGPMVCLPKGWPMYCRDLKQELDRLGNPKVPFKADHEHHALSDAKWIKRAHEWLSQPAPRGEGRPG